MITGIVLADMDDTTPNVQAEAAHSVKQRHTRRPRKIPGLPPSDNVNVGRKWKGQIFRSPTDCDPLNKCEMIRLLSAATGKQLSELQIEAARLWLNSHHIETAMFEQAMALTRENEIHLPTLIRLVVAKKNYSKQMFRNQASKLLLNAYLRYSHGLEKLAAEGWIRDDL